MHQGDQDGVKGVYHINAVDCVTQWELVASCEKLSVAFLLPVIEQLLAGFPFEILGFHADNGSEYINLNRTPKCGRLPCYGFVVPSSLVDIGTPERYRKADEDHRR